MDVGIYKSHRKRSIEVPFGFCLGSVWVLVGFYLGLFQILVEFYSNPIQVVSLIRSEIYKTIRYSVYSSSVRGDPNHPQSVYSSYIITIKSSPSLSNLIILYFPILEAHLQYSLVQI